jgi:hypothetical protein
MPAKSKANRSGKTAPSAPVDVAPEPIVAPTTPAASSTWWLAGIVIAVVLALAVYLLRLDRVVGLFVDDAWYALLAQALATGQGYQLINSPTPGILPSYPPLYSFLLSLAYRLSPSFPNNLLLLKSVSVLAMMGVGALSYRHFRRDRQWPMWLSLVTALAVTLAPSLVFLATSSTMSECVYMLFQLLAVVLIETSVRADAGKRVLLYAALGGAAGAAAFLTRSIGLAVIGAVAVYLLKERRWPALGAFVVAALLLAAPWLIYSRAHKTTPEQRQEQAGMIVLPYDVQFWQRRAGDASSGTIKAGDLPTRIWNNATMVFSNNPARLFTPSFYRSSKLSGEEVLEKGTETKLLGLLFSALILLGLALTIYRQPTAAEFTVLFTFLIATVWPWDPYRFMLPLAPFAFFYLLEGLRAIHTFAQQKMETKTPRPAWTMMTVTVGLVLALYLFDHALYWRARNDPTPAEYLPWQAIFDEHKAALDWLREKTPEDAAIVSENPALVYLYTGRKTMAGERPEERWEDWKRHNVRYMARLSVYQIPDPSLADGRFNQAYRSKGPLKLRVVDFGPKETRRSWSAFGSSGQMRMDDLK